MKTLIDFLVIIAFFAAHHLSGKNMLVATQVAIGAAVLQWLLMKWLRLPMQKIHVIGLVMVVVFGGMALFFNRPEFFQWKFSIMEWLMGAALIIAHVGFKKNGMQWLMGSELQLPELVWTRMMWSWALFFISMGCLNFWVMHRYDFDVWVNFKTFWVLGLTVVFMLAQGMWLSRYLKDGDES